MTSRDDVVPDRGQHRRDRLLPDFGGPADAEEPDLFDDGVARGILDDLAVLVEHVPLGEQRA